MLDLLVLFAFLILSEVPAAATLSETGMAGKEVTIRCSHSYASTNVKYFCKGACDEEDILVRSSKHKDSNGKYSIKDEGNTFTVTISGLTEDDSGTYWCGIERVGVDTYNEVVLTRSKNFYLILKHTTYPPVTRMEYKKYPTAVGLVCLALLLIVVLVVLLCKHRHTRRQGKGQKHSNAHIHKHSPALLLVSSFQNIL
uniref:Ig-like domain-containing protein n=1 Tax=Gasterosteus aculeatus aculeatus TaxID=481459 RepID=A0AAQ4R904_GASAC